MPDEAGDFRHSDLPEPHRSRTKAILRDHPEVRGLFGNNPWSAAVIACVVTLQFTLAYLLRDQPWWAVVAAAWCVGAFCNHAMYVMIHDAAHSLIFRRRAFNELAAIVADCPNIIPAAMSFRSYHLKHHAHQGVYEVDADLPSRWEAVAIGNSPLTKTLWFLFFPIFEMFRPLRLRSIRFLTAWTMLNWLAVFSADAAVCWYWGPQALAYLGLSFLFSVGLHPLGGRWVQEHYLIVPDQETYSYYGPLNRLAFNVGYHNEHHDFASIPWNRLPQLKQLAPEYYETLVWHRSWTRLVFQFIFDRRLSHFSRTVRTAEVDRAKPTPPAVANLRSHRRTESAAPSVSSV
jgi:sphingolipid delta-4 desaturase